MQLLSTLLLSSAVLAKYATALSFASFSNSNTVTNALTVYWNISSSNVTFGVDAASGGKWVGLGIAEPTSGSMGGADLAILEVSGGSVKVSDYWAGGKFTPIKDTCEAWYLIKGEVTSSGNVQAIFTRALDSKDSQDRAINTTVGYLTRMIWAMGSTSSLSYHSANRGSFGLYLNGGAPGQANSSWSSSSFRFSNYTIPNDTTTYACLGLDLPIDKSYYIKRFEFINSNTTVKAQVHHLVVYSCPTGSQTFAFYKNNPSLCFQATSNDCQEVMYVWAPGQDVFDLPADVSFAMGGTNGATSIMLQMHYTNPQQVQGETDSSGFKMYYDTVATRNLAGVMQVGDAFLQSSPLAAGQGQIHNEYTCPNSCTNQMNGSITLFGSFLHAHAQGTMLYSTITNSTGSVSALNRIEYYDYGFQQITSISKTLSPGDRINTHCVFQTTDRTSPVSFGLATTNEMCIEFLFFYPRSFGFTECTLFKPQADLNGTYCNQTFQAGNPVAQDSITLLNKVFGVEPTQCYNFASNNTTQSKSAISSGCGLMISMLILLLSFLLV